MAEMAPATFEGCTKAEDAGRPPLRTDRSPRGQMPRRVNAARRREQGPTGMRWRANRCTAHCLDVPSSGDGARWHPSGSRLPTAGAFPGYPRRNGLAAVLIPR